MNWRDESAGYWIGVEEGGYAAECDRDRWQRISDDLADTIQRIRILASNGNPMSQEKVAITLEMVDEQARAALLRYSQARGTK